VKFKKIGSRFGSRNDPNTMESLNLPRQVEVKVLSENLDWKDPFVLLARDEETRAVDGDGTAMKSAPLWSDHTSATSQPR
jgi:hypothetical protein